MKIVSKSNKVTGSAILFPKEKLNKLKELYENLDNHYAIIDQEIIWHGGINLLGRPDIYDNLIRLKSADVAAELLTLEK